MADDPGENGIRDRMAMIRTVLANERTLLAYLRTSLGLSATGATVIHFSADPAAYWLGTILILIGFALLAYGVSRFRSTRGRIGREASG